MKKPHVVWFLGKREHDDTDEVRVRDHCRLCGFLAYAPADVKEQAAPSKILNRSSDDSSLAYLVKASGYEGELPPQP